MEEESFSKRFNSLRTIFSNWSIHKRIFRKFSLGKSFGSFGFTLIELLTVIGVLSVIFTIAIAIINPLKQIQKLRDAQRESNLKQISNAMDTFYNDNDAYPIDIGELDDASKYMQSIPADPSNADTTDYLYIADTSDSLPQWYALFASLENKDSSKSLCALEKIQANDGCLPQGNRDTNGDLIYNYCVVAGDVDCAYINSFQL